LTVADLAVTAGRPLREHAARVTILSVAARALRHTRVPSIVT
jgi:hypothetical protein